MIGARKLAARCCITGSWKGMTMDGDLGSFDQPVLANAARDAPSRRCLMKWLRPLWERGRSHGHVRDQSSGQEVPDPYWQSGRALRGRQ